jgi:hypothetical protein
LFTVIMLNITTVASQLRELFYCCVNRYLHDCEVNTVLNSTKRDRELEKFLAETTIAK